MIWLGIYIWQWVSLILNTLYKNKALSGFNFTLGHGLPQGQQKDIFIMANFKIITIISRASCDYIVREFCLDIHNANIYLPMHFFMLHLFYCFYYRDDDCTTSSYFYFDYFIVGDYLAHALTAIGFQIDDAFIEAFTTWNIVNMLLNLKIFLGQAPASLGRSYLLRGLVNSYREVRVSVLPLLLKFTGSAWNIGHIYCDDELPFASLIEFQISKSRQRGEAPSNRDALYTWVGSWHYASVLTRARRASSNFHRESSWKYSFYISQGTWPFICI